MGGGALKSKVLENASTGRPVVKVRGARGLSPLL